jgi:hypothetical protein
MCQDNGQLSDSNSTSMAEDTRTHGEPSRLGSLLQASDETDTAPSTVTLRTDDSFHIQDGPDVGHCAERIEVVDSQKDLFFMFVYFFYYSK